MNETQSLTQEQYEVLRKYNSQYAEPNKEELKILKHLQLMGLVRDNTWMGWALTDRGRSSLFAYERVSELQDTVQRAREALDIADRLDLRIASGERDPLLCSTAEVQDIKIRNAARQTERNLLAALDQRERELAEAREALKPFRFTADELFETQSFADDDVIYLRPDDGNDSVSNAWSKKVTFADIRRVVSALLSDAPPPF